MKLSIVTTLYHSSKHLADFHSRASEAARTVVGPGEYELIMVNDGSPDDSLEQAVSISKVDPAVRVINLSRNFGHHHAMTAGLAEASGERVFLIDSDLEESPEWLLKFDEAIERSGADVIFGVQKQRKGGLFERFSGWLFYVLFDLLTGFRFPRNMVTARLMKRRYVSAFLTFQERVVSIGGLFYLAGFDQRPLMVNKVATSQSTYTLRRKLSLFVDSVVSFSSKPLVGIFLFGLFILTISLLISAFYVVNALLFIDPPDGWTTLIVSIWLLGGLIISSIGVVGIYLSRVYYETKLRPSFLIKSVFQNGVEIDHA